MDDWQSDWEKLFVGTPYATFRRLRELVVLSIQLEARSARLRREGLVLHRWLVQLYQRSDQAWHAYQAGTMRDEGRDD
jgi:hypothetical protein